MGVRVLEVVCDQGKLRSQLSCCVDVGNGVLHGCSNEGRIPN